MGGALLSGLAARILPQNADLAMGFEASAAPGRFVVRSFSGIEELFDEFEITVDLVSNYDDLDLHALLDTPASLGIYHKYDQPRFIHGQIAEIEKGQAGITRCYYRVVLKPALHRLNYHSDSRIFQNLSVIDISKTVLQENDIVDTQWDIAFDHSVREYCVQYGETSLAYLKRIWAEEGIFYWFEHSESGHKMIISDAPLGMPVLKAAQSITYNNMPGGTGKGSWVCRFNQVERLRATNRVSRDYSFKRPAYHQQHSVGQYMPNGVKGKYELYHYPGRHKFPNAGQPFNDHALEAHRVEATTADGETNNIQLSAGFIFALTDHPDEKANIQHRLLRVIHEGHQPAALEEEAPDGAATTYTAHFTSQPARLPYRPINPNPKPMVEGPQIAHVTGPEGEEIYCDEHGRVKIWFPWDRHGEKNEKSSCWVRVAQNWAGGTWGHMAIPRIGHEVVVDFLGGDPDQPLITGRTYHATNRPPYQLPANKTKMVIRSDTHKGKGFNEISFEDSNGEEEIYLHAQKDHTLHVENNRAKRVDVNQYESVGHNKSIEIGNNHEEVIGGNVNIVVGANRLPKFVSQVHAKLGSALRNKASGILGQAVRMGAAGLAGLGKGNMTVSVGANKAETVAVSSTETVGINKASIVGGARQDFTGGSYHSFSGQHRMDEVLRTITQVAGERWQVGSGKTSIVLDAASGKITIKADEIELDGKSSVTIKGGRIDLN